MSIKIGDKVIIAESYYLTVRKGDIGIVTSLSNCRRDAFKVKRLISSTSERNITNAGSLIFDGSSLAKLYER